MIPIWGLFSPLGSPLMIPLWKFLLVLDLEN